MRTNIPERLLKILDEIDSNGSANLTRLTVLKRWFAEPGRLSAFAVWIAKKAVSRKGKTAGEAAALFGEAKDLLAGVDEMKPELDRAKAEALHDRLREFQNEHVGQRWGPVRKIKNWNLLLVEQSIAICLWHFDSPEHGYRVAADHCQHFDPRHGTGLSGPSRTKIDEIVRFMFVVEAREEDASL